MIIWFKHTNDEVTFKQATTTLLQSFGVEQRITIQ